MPMPYLIGWNFWRLKGLFNELVIDQVMGPCLNSVLKPDHDCLPLWLTLMILDSLYRAHHCWMLAYQLSPWTARWRHPSQKEQDVRTTTNKNDQIMIEYYSSTTWQLLTEYDMESFPLDPLLHWKSVVRCTYAFGVVWRSVVGQVQGIDS
jgi:hypothetical protein